MTKKRKEEIENKVNSILIKYQYNNDILKLVKELNYDLIRLELTDGLNGMCRYMPSYDKFIIVINSNDILSRQLFTIAHEIGHSLLHFENKSLFVDYNDCKIDEMEREANYFASCLLMPKELIENYINTNPYKVIKITYIAKLVKEFKVSFSAAICRLNSLGYISDYEKDCLLENKQQNSLTKILSLIDGPVDLCRPTNDKTTYPSEYLDWIINNYNKKLIPKDKLEEGLTYLGLVYDDISILIDFKENNLLEVEDLLI